MKRRSSPASWYGDGIPGWPGPRLAKIRLTARRPVPRLVRRPNNSEGDMKAIDRRAAEFRALQEGIIARLRDLDLTAMGHLSMALTVQEFRSLGFLVSAEPRKTKELAEYLG